MKIFAFALFSILFQFASADLRSSHALKTELKYTSFEATLTDGFHFNYKAPNKLILFEKGSHKSIEPQVTDPRKLSFSFKSKDEALFANLYVCDDKVTFCESHKIELQKHRLNQSRKSEGAKRTHLDNGFQMGNSTELLAKTKNLALLDFSAKWCPGCVRFDTEVFPNSKFKKAAKNYNRIRIDVDLFENADLATKYKVVGIPTLIVTDSLGNEIERLVGFDTLSKTIAFLASAEGDKTPLKDFHSKTEFKSIEQRRLAGKRLSLAEENDRVVEILKDIQPSPPELTSALVAIAKKDYESKSDLKNEIDKSSREKLLQNYKMTLEKALKNEPETTRSIGWRTELMRLSDSKSEISKLKAQSLDLLAKWNEDPQLLKTALSTDSPGEFVGIEKWLLLEYKVDLLEAAGETEEELQKVYREAAKLGQDLQIPIEQVGLNLRLLVMITASKDWEAAEKQVQRMIQHDPQDFELRRRQLKILLALKKFKEAKSIAENIIKNAPGRNEFWVAESLAKALLGLEDKIAARQLIMAYLAKEEVNSEKMVSIKKSFESLLASTEGSSTSQNKNH